VKPLALYSHQEFILFLPQNVTLYVIAVNANFPSLVTALSSEKNIAILPQVFGVKELKKHLKNPHFVGNVPFNLLSFKNLRNRHRIASVCLYR